MKCLYSNKKRDIDESGFYFDLKRVRKANVPFNVIIGGRGTGKTYTCLYDVRMDELESKEELDEDSKFIYLRRTETQIKKIANPKFNPFKALNRDKGFDIKAVYSSSEESGAFYAGGNEDFVGYAFALSTFGNLRGADLTDASSIVFDEFMRGKNERPMPNEADEFFNTYETIARNRELICKPPVKVYLLTNARDLNSPLMAELGVIEIYEKMLFDGHDAYTSKSRGLHVEILKDLPVSDAKKDTALYKLLSTQRSKYVKHAIDNEFSYDSFLGIKKMPLTEFTPLLQVEDLYIYQHKSKQLWYITMSKCNVKNVYNTDAIPVFKRTVGMKIHMQALRGNVCYSDFTSKSKFFTYF